ncbi:MAG: hypothetical protein ACRDVG_13420 [Jatrophihabitantaceae bacterium]
MPRHNRRRADVPLTAPSGRATRTEHWHGAAYLVRTVTAASAVKAYRCPGCDQLIVVGVAHLVAWPAEDANGADRRHWHTPCWGARDRRRPTRR